MNPYGKFTKLVEQRLTNRHWHTFAIFDEFEVHEVMSLCYCNSDRKIRKRISDRFPDYRDSSFVYIEEFPKVREMVFKAIADVTGTDWKCGD